MDNTRSTVQVQRTAYCVLYLDLKSRMYQVLYCIKVVENCTGVLECSDDPSILHNLHCTWYHTSIPQLHMQYELQYELQYAHAIQDV
jgi:hypothetical protein